VSLELLRDIAAAPRPTGSDAIATARGLVARELEALGFQTRERPFEFSTFPGRFATPLLGAAMLILVGVAGHFGARSERWIPLLVIVVGGFVVKLGAEWVRRRGTVAIPLLRARGVNLEATRLAGMPHVWLCAHLDTKSQPVPSLIRVAGLVLCAIGYNTTIVLAIIAAIGRPPHFIWWASAALVTLAGAIPVVLSVVTARSPGALDNASGIATVVETARLLGDANIGILITDGEELGLAGARAWASRPRDAYVLNCDGVDDQGANVVLLGKRPGPIASALPRATKTRTAIPGVLTDANAFADEGVPAVTFMRGGWGSLARVHSRSDDLAHLRGTGIAEVAALMAATARQLGGRS